jgi:uncharacterized flavoprotein (TIGR03862 family)
MQTKNPWVAVIGGGPAGLMAAEVMAKSGLRVVVYDRMPSLGRKFLMAGRGGLNLTHSEDLPAFLARYGAAADVLKPYVEAFNPQALREWAQELGEETFVGSSGRVFPKSFKASPLLRAWLRQLSSLGVEVRLRHKFLGFSAEGLRFDTPEGEVAVSPLATVLALGGASWPRLGSDGGWVAPLTEAGLTIAPLQSSNAGVEIAWSEHVQERFAGTPLKSVSFRFGDRQLRGEAVVTRTGLEGGAIYALSPALRDAAERDGVGSLYVDLRPDVARDELANRLAWPRGKQSMGTFLRKAAGLSPVAAALLREVGPLPAEMDKLATRIKNLRLQVTGVRPLARAISTAGGLTFGQLDARLMLRDRPGVFVAGEMLDWEAPTGGYLLQACFATGAAAGAGVLDFLSH